MDSPLELPDGTQPTLDFRAPQVKEQVQGNVVRELRTGLLSHSLSS